MIKVFAKNYNNILNDIIPFYKETSNLLSADVCLTWNDLVNPNKKIVELCKEHGIPSFVVEHGMKAVSDYQKNLKDTHNNMGGKELIADNIMVWGDKSKEIMLDAGVSKDRIHVVGSPIIWDHKYTYSSNNGETKTVPFNAGQTVIDPQTKDEWQLEGITSEVPRNEKRSIIVFFPHHDWTPRAIEKNRLVWEQIKDIPNVFVKLSKPYMNRHENNPFREILDIEDDNERRIKCIGIDTNSPNNLQFIKKLLTKAAMVITAIPGTINGICWSMDVPIIVPQIDWDWKENGKTIYDIWPADYRCKVEELENMVWDVKDNDTLTKERLEYANYFMGLDKGSSSKNIISILDDIK